MKTTLIPRSFRDPSGFIFEHDNRILRYVHESENLHLQEILTSSLITALTDRHQVISSTLLSKEQTLHLLTNNILTTDLHDLSNGLIVEHERIDFPSYPYEWAPEMLYHAGLLTLELAEKLLEDDLGLKDASPYNILFKGPAPVFIDLLSFEKRKPNNPIWLPYAQFVNNFLLPLMANKHFHIPLSQIFTTKRDGLNAEDLYPLAKGIHKFRPSVLSLVILPKLLSSWISRSQKELSIYNERLLKDAKQAKFVLKMLFKQLRRKLNGLAPSDHLESQWNSYMTLEKSYSDEEFQEKQAFVNTLLSEIKPKNVLDVGANAGTFSMIAAQQGCKVVSIDFDPVVIGKLYQKAKKLKLNILPLVIDFGRPSPSIGWQNRENLSFLDRAKGKFDLVLMLAIIHHLLVQERIPMNEIASLMAEITKKHLVIEYVSPKDPMFCRIARGRDHLYKHLTQEFFEQVFKQHFNIQSRHQEGNKYRTIYLMDKK